MKVLQRMKTIVFQPRVAQPGATKKERMKARIREKSEGRRTKGLKEKYLRKISENSEGAGRSSECLTTEKLNIQSLVKSEHNPGQRLEDYMDLEDIKAKYPFHRANDDGEGVGDACALFGSDGVVLRVKSRRVTSELIS